MTGRKLLELCKNTGNGSEILVRFTDLIADTDTRFEKGMIAKVIDCKKVDDSIIKLVVSEEGLLKYNLGLEKDVWFDKDENQKKYSELYDRDEKQLEEFFDNYNIIVANIEIVNEEEKLQIEGYCKADTTKSYQEWLKGIYGDRNSEDDLKSRLTQAIMDYGNSDDASCYDAEDMAAYLMEVIRELHGTS